MNVSARPKSQPGSSLRRWLAMRSEQTEMSRLRILDCIAALVAALIFGAVLLLTLGHNPMTAYGALWHGAFGGWTALAQSLGTSTPLVLTAIGISISFRSGFFNIGAGGQLGMGCAAAALVGAYSG